MTQNLVLKVVTFAVLCIFMLSLGINCFAAQKPVDSINWTYLINCDYDFDIVATDETYKYFDIMGGTTTGSPRNGYVKVELQQYKNGGWNTIYTLTDEDYMAAAVEDDYYAAPIHYTYRLKITHKAKTTGGTTLETFTQTSYTL